MSYTTTNYRSIKNFSGGRGLVSQMKTNSVASGNNKINSSGNGKTEETTGNTASNAALKAQLKTYSNIAIDSAEDLQENGEALTEVGENSLFDKAEKSKDNKKVVSEVTDFVNNYNNMMSGINKLGGSENKAYMKELKKFADANEDALKEIGITVLKDGSLTMNKKELEAAPLDKLKELFNGDKSFAGKVTDLSGDIKENVEKKLKENLLILSGVRGSSSSSRNSGISARGSFFDTSV